MLAALARTLEAAKTTAEYPQRQQKERTPLTSLAIAALLVEALHFAPLIFRTAPGHDRLDGLYLVLLAINPAHPCQCQ